MTGTIDLRMAAAALAVALGGCGSGTVAITSNATRLWATNIAALTCTLATPAGRPPTTRENCDITFSPPGAGTVFTPVTIPASAGSGPSVFTAAAVQQDTLATVTASWRQDYVWDPSASVAIMVHPPRVSATFGTLVVLIEPSVTRNPASGWLQFTYVIQAMRPPGPGPVRGLDLIVPSFRVPVTLLPQPICTSGTLGTTAALSTPPFGPATAFLIDCTGILAETIVVTFEVDGSVGGTTDMSVVVYDTGTFSVGSVGLTPTGPLP